MELYIWKKDFKNYMDFVYEKKRYPSKSTNIDELYLFNWAKKQRFLYTKKKLSDDKVKMLNDYNFWYFKTKDKNKKMNEINNFFKVDEIKIEQKVKNVIENKNIVINIANLNLFYDKHEQKETNQNYCKKIIDKVFSLFNFLKSDQLLIKDSV